MKHPDELQNTLQISNTVHTFGPHKNTMKNEGLKPKDMGFHIT